MIRSLSFLLPVLLATSLAAAVEITQQPQSMVAAAGQPVALSIAASGSGVVSCQWHRDGRPVAGAVSSSISFASLSLADTGLFHCVVSDESGSEASHLARVALSGQPAAWRNGQLGVVNWPVNSPVMMLADAEPRLAVRTDGSVAFMPADGPGMPMPQPPSGVFSRLSFPSGLDPVVSLAVRAPRAIALKADGTVISWRYLKPASDTSDAAYPLPPGIGRALAVSLTAFTNAQALALRLDGTVAAWSIETGAALSTPAGLANVIAISSGGDHHLALKADGTVTAWGDNLEGESTVPAGLADVIAVSAGPNYSLALRSDGTVTAWGTNFNGETTVPAGLSGITRIYAGGSTALVWQSDGGVTGWGDPPIRLAGNVPAAAQPLAQAGITSSSNTGVAVGIRIDGPPIVLAHPQSLAVIEAEPASFTVAGHSNEPFTIQWLKNGSPIPGATAATFAIAEAHPSDNGSYVARLTNSLGSSDSQPATLTVAAAPWLSAQPASALFDIGSPVTITAAAAGTGSLSFQWHKNGRPIAGAASAVLSIPAAAESNAGLYQLRVTDANGERWSRFARLAPRSHVIGWTNGSLFHPDPADGPAPDLLMLAAGEGNLALAASGSLVRLEPANLGLQPKMAVLPVGLPAGVGQLVSLAGGGSLTAALSSDGKVAVWGQANTLLPQPANLGHVIDVAVTYNRAFALRADGSVIAWDTANGAEVSLTPSSANHGMVSIVAASTHIAGLRTDGTVAVMDWAGGGSLLTLPAPPGLASVTSIAAEDMAMFAVKGDGTLAVWGSSQLVANAPASISDVSRLVTSGTTAYAVHGDGGITSWSTSTAAAPLPAVRRLRAAAASQGANVGLASAFAPAIILQPQGVSVLRAESVMLTADATGVPAPSLQWHRNGTAIPGATGKTLFIPFAALADAGSYTFTATNSQGAATSDPAIVTVQDVPEFVNYPQSATVSPGQSVTLSVQAQGNSPFTYQWSRNGKAIAGAAGDSFTVASVEESNTGVYSVTVTDSFGSQRTALARVSLPGAVLQWSGGQIQPPISAAAVIPVALSEGDSSLAVGSQGEVLWTLTPSSHWSGSSPVLAPAPAGSQPADLGPVVQLAALGNRIAAVQTDGTVRAWARGGNIFGNWPGSGWTHTPIAIPADAVHGKAVALGFGSFVIIRWDGTVAVVSQAGDPLANVPAGLANVAAVSISSPATTATGFAEHCLALRGDGTVAAWGLNDLGQCDVPAGLSDVVQIAAGYGFSLALKSDGSVVQWGRRSGGLIGGGTDLTAPPSGGHRGIRAGGSRAFAVTTAGQAVSWMPSWPFPDSSFDPVPPPVSGVLDVSDRVWSVGNGSSFSYAFRALCLASAPVIEAQPESVAAFTGDTVFLSVQASGRPLPGYQWHKNGSPIADATSAELKIADFEADDAGSYTVVVSNLHGSVTSLAAAVSLAAGPDITVQPQNLALHPGQGGSLSVTATGSGSLSYQWLKDGKAIPGATAASLAIPSGLPADAGLYQVIITDANGSRRSRLARVGEGAVPAGWRSGLAVDYANAFNFPPVDVFLALSEGEGWLGIGANGNLGWFYESGIMFPSPLPMSFPGQRTSSTPARPLVAVATRAKCGLAVDAAGQVTAWESRTTSSCYTTLSIPGSSSCFPSDNVRFLPVPAAARNAITVSIAANEQALALRPDGRVIEWHARWGSLSSPPAAVGSGVLAISSGADHHLALKNDGTVIAWGDNSEGECNVPAGLANVGGIAALENVSFAIHADGTVTAWGANDLGQTNVPVGLSGVARISGAKGTVLAVKGDGSLVTWGTGSATQIPASITNVRSAGIMPVADPAPGQIILSSTGSYGVALVPVGAPLITQQPVTKRVFPGFTGVVFTAGIGGFPSGSFTAAWQKNGVPLAAPQPVSSYSSSLSLTNVALADAGEYRLSVGNGWQTGYSQAVMLEVVPPRLFADWQAANFTAAERTAGLDAPNADPGGFGIPNLLRYAFGLDPRSPSRALLPQPEYVPPVPGGSLPGGIIAIGQSDGIRLSFDVPQDTADLNFFLESSPNLQSWTRSSSLPSLGLLQSGRRQASFTGYSTSPLIIGSPPGPQRFFRLAVEPAAPRTEPAF